MRAVLLASIATLSAATVATPAGAQSACGLTEELEQGETVAEMANRCGVTVEGILEANDAATIEDLETGATLALPLISEDTAEQVGEAGQQAVEEVQDAGQQAADTVEDAGETVAEEAPNWLAQARKAVDEAGQRIEEGAAAAGRSASEYLSENPDLNQDIIRLGERIGLPGVQSQPESGPRLEAEPAQNGQVQLRASGLPGGEDVVIGLQTPGGTEEIRRLRTEDDGSLAATIDLPEEQMPADETPVFVIETGDKRLRLASDPYREP